MKFNELSFCQPDPNTCFVPKSTKTRPSRLQAHEKGRQIYFGNFFGTSSKICLDLVCLVLPRAALY